MRSFRPVMLMAIIGLALPAAASALTPVWTGTWSTSRGPMTVTAEGAQLTGVFGYADSSNNPFGHLKGTASGLTLVGTWSFDDTAHAPLDHGSVVLTFGVVGGKATFRGDIGYEANGTVIKGGWTGSCLTGPCAEDREAPTVKALAATGTPGKPMFLMYNVADNSNKTSETVSVYRGASLVWRTTVPLREITSGATYKVAYRVPPGAAGTFRFTVQARDAAKNASSPSSARITIRHS